MKIISHRGGSALAPENSLEAIKVSRILKVDAIEIDIHITKDNKLVVFHDPDLKRLAGDTRFTYELNLAEIREITLNNGAKIPTLTEVIKAAGDIRLFIEGKGGNWAKLLTKELAKHKFINEPKVISFNEAELKKFHDQNTHIGCYLLEIFRGLSSIKKAKKEGYEGIDIHFLGMNPLVKKRAEKAGLNIVLYTLNSDRIFNFFNKVYPNIAVTTDRPDILMKVGKPILK